MSLILTQSNSAPGSNPASYVNRFKNTFEIKANAEIAVQEVVLNRQGKFEVSSRARLYFRHGTDAWHTPLVAIVAAATRSCLTNLYITFALCPTASSFVFGFILNH